MLHPSRQKVINVSKLNDLRVISVEPRRLVSYSEFHEGYVGWWIGNGGPEAKDPRIDVLSYILTSCVERKVVGKVLKT